MQDKDFIVKVRRLPGYEPTVAIRFEMNEGFGEMLVGPNRKASPSTAGDLPEARGEQIRVGRFVHVLASGRRRQSYALSRLDDDRLQRLPDSGWTELVPVTEFGIRYLDLPELGPMQAFAAVQVSSEPTPARAHSASPSAGARAASVRPAAHASVQPATARAAASMPSPRASSAIPASSRLSSQGAPARVTPSSHPLPSRTVTPETSRRVASPRPVPVRTVDGLGSSPVPAPVSLESGLGQAAVRSLTANEAKQRLLTEMSKVAQLLQHTADLENKLEQSRARERDLLDVLSRWQERG